MRILLPLVMATCAAAQNAAVDRIFSALDKKDSPGCSVVVTRAGRVIYTHGYGMADLDHDLPITPASVFHVASISKEFTAASILMLEQEGKLSIDDDVHKYIPELPDFGVKITLRHLLHHSSGLRDQWSLLGLAGWRVNLDLITDQDVLDILSRQKALNFPPGEQYLYSNSGYTLLAITVKRVSGKSIRQFAQEMIFAPLGMTHTFFRDNHGEIVKQQAYGYVPDGKTFDLRVPQFDTTGATSLLTTADDFAKWMANFDEPRVAPKVIAKMQQRGRFNSGAPMDYAFGLQPGTYRGLAITGHGGADAGYRADFLRFPEQQLSVGCLCNLGSLNPRNFTKQVAEVYLGGKMAPEPKPAVPPAGGATVPESALGLFYNRDLGDVRRLARRDGKLMLYSPGPRWEEVVPISASDLVLANGNGKVSLTGGHLTETRTGSPATVFERRAEAAPKNLALYAGVYHSDELDTSYEVVLRESKLWVRRRKFSDMPMTPTLADCFVAAVDGSEAHLEFKRNGAGKVVGFQLNAGRVRHIQFNR
jgi:CubicO group peptidase (beta-lactamase class C family)